MHRGLEICLHLQTTRLDLIKTVALHFQLRLDHVATSYDIYLMKLFWCAAQYTIEHILPFSLNRNIISLRFPGELLPPQTFRRLRDHCFVACGAQTTMSVPCERGHRSGDSVGSRPDLAFH
jgi:hypothetical protein